MAPPLLTLSSFMFGMARSGDRVDGRPTERGTFRFQQVDARDHGVLLVLAEGLEPGAELVGVEDFPHAQDNVKLISHQRDVGSWSSTGDLGASRPPITSAATRSVAGMKWA